MTTEEAIQSRASRAPLKLAVAVLWKTPALIVALIVGAVAANSLGWNGAAFLLGGRGNTEGLGGFLNHFILIVAFVGCAVVLYFVRSVARWALWGFVPVMAYAALVLGVWDGLASGFDVTRREAIKHHAANAYALRHMSPHGLALSCDDARISLTDDAKAVCATLPK